MEKDQDGKDKKQIWEAELVLRVMSLLLDELFDTDLGINKEKIRKPFD